MAVIGADNHQAIQSFEGEERFQTLHHRSLWQSLRRACAHLGVRFKYDSDLRVVQEFNISNMLLAHHAAAN